MSYATNEMIPSSEFAKKFGSYLAQIKDNKVDKLAILKNNKVEAVLISKDEYEYMCEALKQIDNKKEEFTIEQGLLKQIVRTTQAIEGYGEASSEVKTKTEELRQRYGIKVSA